jgi:hypothetical protein
MQGTLIRTKAQFDLDVQTNALAANQITYAVGNLNPNAAPKAIGWGAGGIGTTDVCALVGQPDIIAAIAANHPMTDEGQSVGHTWHNLQPLLNAIQPN